MSRVFECSRLNKIGLDNKVDEPLLLSKKKQAPRRKERNTKRELAVESKDSAFQRHGAHHRSISPMRSDVCVKNTKTSPKSSLFLEERSLR